jgi:hypothetical protein
MDSSSSSSTTTTTNKHNRFNQTLVIFLRTLKERCSDDPDLVEEFQAAIVLVETANLLSPTVPLQLFKKHFLNSELVNCVRNQDAKGALPLLYELGKNEDSEVLKSLAHLGQKSDVDEGVLPWKTLIALYKDGMDMDVSKKVESRVQNFNQLYRAFLDEMGFAFLHEEEDRLKLLDKFDDAVLYNPWSVYDEFKVHAHPFIEQITQGMTQGMQGALGSSSGNNSSAVAKELSELPSIYDDPEVLFAKLPFVSELPLRKYWQVQIVECTEQYQYVAETFTQLNMTVIGLPTGIFNKSTMETVTNLVAEKLEKEGLDPSASADSTSMQNIFGMAMGIMGELQENGQLETLMSGFNADSIDLDMDLVNNIAENIDLPPDMQLMIDAASVGEQPIAASVAKKID